MNGFVKLKTVSKLSILFSDTSCISEYLITATRNKRCRIYLEMTSLRGSDVAIQRGRAGKFKVEVHG